MENKIISAVEAEKLVVIVRGVGENKLIPLAEAMYNGGVRLLEITYSADGSVSDGQTAANINILKEHFGDRMHIGAGTVLTPEQVLLTKDAGGEFIISPDTVEAVIKTTKEQELVSMPGAFTPSEIRAAHCYGADFVKVFPAVSVGAEYIKAVKAPLSNIRLLAVGGVNLNNIPDFLSAGACGFGIGGNIVNRKMIEDGDFEGITELARRYVAAVHGQEI